jgi:predicted nuclease of predicted toxin-antitoxin system
MARLEAAGHDVVWAADEPDPGDIKLLELANSQKRILITLDNDFGKLAIFHGQPHSGIIRLVDMNYQEQAIACLQALLDHGQELLSGAIITAERNRLRKRLPND